MASTYETASKCLEEGETELLKIGEEKCESLTKRDQLSAVVFLLLRATSLFRSSLDLLAKRRLDAYDAVRRAYLEAWDLALQFRLQNQPVPGQLGKWLARDTQSWSAALSHLDTWAKQQGAKTPSLGKDYGELSKLAHPTLDATENSVSLITWRRGISRESASVEAAISNFEQRDIPELLYRYAWLLLHQHPDLIPLYVDDKRTPELTRYADDYSSRL